MVQAAHLRKRDDPTGFRSLDWPGLRRIFVQSEVRPALVIIGHETSEVAEQVAFGRDDHVVEAFAADRAYHTLDVGALPGRAGRRQYLRHPHRRDLIHKVAAEDAVPVMQQIARCRIPRKGFAELLSGPCSRG